MPLKNRQLTADLPFLARGKWEDGTVNHRRRLSGQSQTEKAPSGQQ
jgi:hypothetical protein